MTTNIFKFIRDDNSVSASLVNVTAFTASQYANVKSVVLFFNLVLASFYKEKLSTELFDFACKLDKSALAQVAAYAVACNETTATRYASLVYRRCETLNARLACDRTVTTNNRLVSKNKALRTSDDLIDLSRITLLSTDTTLASYKRNATTKQVMLLNAATTETALATTTVQNVAQVETSALSVSNEQPSTSVEFVKTAKSTSKAKSTLDKRKQRLAERETALATISE